LAFDLFGQSMRTLFGVEPINLSVAVWVGVIALVGIATDDGVVMATYLHQSFSEDPPKTREEVRARTLDAGLRRVRPCLMTTATTFIALLPVVTSTGRGADLMRPMAVPILGGMAIELLTLFVVPVLYGWLERRKLTA
jgi:Cu(I)/Ag(I) efflux system membrane protein CusA/SilA